MLKRLFLIISKAAKNFVLNLMSAGIHKPCDDLNNESLTFDLPIWYDEQKFKRFFYSLN